MSKPVETPQVLEINLSLEPPPQDGFTAKLEAEALKLLKAGEADKAMNVISEARRLGALVPVHEYRDMTSDELEQAKIDTATHEQFRSDRDAAALAALVATRNSYLQQTDWTVASETTQPHDLPTDVRTALKENRAAWVKWRQQLRDYPATVKDPRDPPPFPTQPSAPAFQLT